MNHSTLPIYGVDFGSKNLAVGVLEDESVVSYFELLKGETARDTHRAVQSLVEKLNPSPNSLVFIEGVYKGINQNTYAKLVRVSHSLEICFQERECHTETIHATSWRSALFGTSRVKKEAANEWAIDNFPFLEQHKKSELSHRADSICIAFGGGIRKGLITLNQ